MWLCNQHAQQVPCTIITTLLIHCLWSHSWKVVHDLHGLCLLALHIGNGFQQCIVITAPLCTAE